MFKEIENVYFKNAYPHVYFLWELLPEGERESRYFFGGCKQKSKFHILQTQARKTKNNCIAVCQWVGIM